MGLAKPVLRTLLAAALAAYAFDCSAAATPEQAMQCCNAMHCSSHGHHGQDCCKTMPSTHGPFVQVASVHGITAFPVAFPVPSASRQCLGLDFSPRTLAPQSPPPPISSSPPC